MGLAQTEKRYYTYEQYLHLEQEMDVRFEYYKGEVFAMAGGTKRHNRLTRTTANLLEKNTASKGCQVYTSDVKLEIAHLDHYVYPDVIVTCHPDDLSNDEMIYVNHPSILVEILSKSTQSYDRDEKRVKYFKIPSLQYYMLIWQTKPFVEVYERKQDFWIYKSYEDLEDEIHLQDSDARLALKAIYQGIDFEL